MSASQLIGPSPTFYVASSVGQTAGLATIALNTSSIAVADPKITANSVVVITLQQAAADATATSFRVSALTAGTGFTISANANATAAVSLAYFVARY